MLDKGMRLGPLPSHAQPVKSTQIDQVTQKQFSDLLDKKEKRDKSPSQKNTVLSQGDREEKPAELRREDIAEPSGEFIFEEDAHDPLLMLDFGMLSRSSRPVLTDNVPMSVGSQTPPLVALAREINTHLSSQFVGFERISLQDANIPIQDIAISRGAAGGWVIQLGVKLGWMSTLRSHLPALVERLHLRGHDDVHIELSDTCTDQPSAVPAVVKKVKQDGKS